MPSDVSSKPTPSAYRADKMYLFTYRHSLVCWEYKQHMVLLRCYLRHYTSIGIHQQCLYRVSHKKLWPQIAFEKTEVFQIQVMIK